MNKYWMPLLVILSLSGCGANDSKPPIEVSIDNVDDSAMYHSQIQVQAVTDDVQITKVTVNRGNNCAVIFWNHWSGSSALPLKFGQGDIGKTPCEIDSIKEVDVDTDQGSFSFTF
jgi:hypothetical protein